MKIFLVLSIICMFLFVNNLHGQEWAPVGAEWRYRTEFFPTDDVWNQLVRVEKDTIVSDQECRKYVVYDEVMNEENSINHIGFTFERNDSIFIWDEGIFLLRYDFSATLGDTITIPSTYHEVIGGSTDSFKVVLDSIAIATYWD